MNAVQKKITALQKKKDQLSTDIDSLLKQRNQALLDIFNRLPSQALHPNILVGGLLHVCEQAATHPELAQHWRETGQKFCRRKSPAASL